MTSIASRNTWKLPLIVAVFISLFGFSCEKEAEITLAVTEFSNDTLSELDNLKSYCFEALYKGKLIAHTISSNGNVEDNFNFRNSLIYDDVLQMMKTHQPEIFSGREDHYDDLSVGKLIFQDYARFTQLFWAPVKPVPRPSFPADSLDSGEILPLYIAFSLQPFDEHGFDPGVLMFRIGDMMHSDFLPGFKPLQVISWLCEMEYNFKLKNVNRRYLRKEKPGLRKKLKKAAKRGLAKELDWLESEKSKN